ncbi:MAG: hypothetical protein ACI92O_000420 [Colwellia sp.]|jgi:hypothetical protein
MKVKLWLLKKRNKTMLNAIALLLASSNSVKFQMLPHESIENHYRIIVSPMLNDKTLQIPLSKQTTESGKAVAQVKNALITPFTITGTIEELSEKLPIALAKIGESRIEAKNNLDTLMKSLNTASSVKPTNTKKNTSKPSIKPSTKVKTTVAKTDETSPAISTIKTANQPQESLKTTHKQVVQSSQETTQVTLF